MKRYAYFMDAETGAVHKIPRGIYEKAWELAESRRSNGADWDSISNILHQFFCTFPIVLHVDWVERVL